MSDTYTCSYCKISSDFYWLNDLEEQYFCVECKDGSAVHMCSECRLSGKPIPSHCHECQSKKKTEEDRASTSLIRTHESSEAMCVSRRIRVTTSDKGRA